MLSSAQISLGVFRIPDKWYSCRIPVGTHYRYQMMGTLVGYQKVPPLNTLGNITEYLGYSCWIPNGTITGYHGYSCWIPEGTISGYRESLDLTVFVQISWVFY